MSRFEHTYKCLETIKSHMESFTPAVNHSCSKALKELEKVEKDLVNYEGVEATVVFEVPVYLEYEKAPEDQEDIESLAVRVMDEGCRVLTTRTPYPRITDSNVKELVNG